MYVDIKEEGLRFTVEDIPWDPYLFEKKEGPFNFTLEKAALCLPGFSNVVIEKAEEKREYRKKRLRTCMKKIANDIRKRCAPARKAMIITILNYLSDKRCTAGIDQAEMFGFFLTSMLLLNCV